MRILLLGSGGREHALAWKITQSPRCANLTCAPGNAGMAALGVACLPLDLMDNTAVVRLAQQREIDLVVVGPEAPLCNGVVDALADVGIAAFGPSAAAARIEGSKAFAKEIMEAAGVRTAPAQTFSDPDAAHAYAEKMGAPLVIKADGLAAGKGVTVCDTLDEATAAIDAALRAGVYGEEGATILVEQYLDGEECSVFAISDGRHVITLAASQDHKRIGEGDTGPNTGGMGAYSPAPVVDDAMLADITRTVMQPVIDTLAARGTPFVGVLYGGLMICKGTPYVIEFNCRFGDPECQVLMPRMRSDLVPLLVAAAHGALAEQTAEWHDAAAACVVLASAGYPGSYEKGLPITGLDAVPQESDVQVFHAGTTAVQGEVRTNGGRVLGVTALGADLRAALAKAYEAVDVIEFEGKYYRRDIGHRALARVSA